MTHLRLWSGVAALVVAIVGCSVRPEPAEPLLPQLAPTASVVSDVAVTGTYDGTLEETQGSHSRSGSCEITLKQSGKSVKGTADVQFDSGNAYKFTIAGSIESNGKKGAKLSITITDDTGSSAKGSATIKGKNIRGKASASGKNGTAYITFTGKRKKLLPIQNHEPVAGRVFPALPGFDRYGVSLDVRRSAAASTATAVVVVVSVAGSATTAAIVAATAATARRGSPVA